MQIVIQFGNDGSAIALHTDDLSLSCLGRMTVKRASLVEFNEDRQKWEVTIVGDAAPSFSNASRAKCLDWERSTLNQRLTMN
jgi:hypothetical protein